MKKIALACVLAVLVFAVLPSCKKSKSTDNEAYLTVETTPANKSNNLNVLGPNFPLTVEITSAIPASGVKIEVTAAPESGGAVFFTATSHSAAPQNNYSITNTPDGVSCVVNITVTSLTKASNVWKGTYRYSKK